MNFKEEYTISILVQFNLTSHEYLPYARDFVENQKDKGEWDVVPFIGVEHKRSGAHI